MWCFHCRRRLAPYIDGALAEGEIRKVDRHLNACARCRQERDRQLAVSAALRSLPEVAPGPAVWQAMEAVLDMEKRRSVKAAPLARPGWVLPKRIAGAAALALAIIAGVLITEIWIAPQPVLIKPAYALDYGMFLDGIAGQSSQWEQFAREYAFHGVSLEEARRATGFALLAPQELPGGLALESVHLLKSGCCRAAALKYSSGRVFLYLFQQPPGHPAFFGGRKVAQAPRWCDSCKWIRARGCQGLYWEEGDRGFVIIANLSEQELTRIVMALRAASTSGQVQRFGRQEGGDQ